MTRPPPSERPGGKRRRVLEWLLLNGNKVLIKIYWFVMIHRPPFYLKLEVSGTGFCLKLQVKHELHLSAKVPHNTYLITVTV
jgi:hypothetical protein